MNKLAYCFSLHNLFVGREIGATKYRLYGVILNKTFFMMYWQWKYRMKWLTLTVATSLKRIALTLKGCSSEWDSVYLFVARGFTNICVYWNVWAQYWAVAVGLLCVTLNVFNSECAWCQFIVADFTWEYPLNTWWTTQKHKQRVTELDSISSWAAGALSETDLRMPFKFQFSYCKQNADYNFCMQFLKITTFVFLFLNKRLFDGNLAHKRWLAIITMLVCL